MHGTTAVMIYATCRRLTVRPAWRGRPASPTSRLSAGLADRQPALAGTPLTVLLLLDLRRRARRGSGRVGGASGALGAVAGRGDRALIAVHQQRGLFVGTGIALWLIADRSVQRRARRAPAAPLTAQLVWLAAGAALVLVPLFIGLVATRRLRAGLAGAGRASALQYRSTMHATWGQSGGLVAEAASYTYPRLLNTCRDSRSSTWCASACSRAGARIVAELRRLLC